MSEESKAKQVLCEALQSGNYNKFVSLIPYAQLIGTEVIQLGEELVYKLPNRDSNIGNILIPSIHGGCIGGFMENAAALQIMFTLETAYVPKVVDFSIDYLRAGKKQDTFAQCEVVRQGRKLVNVSVTAWQNSKSEPIATARAHFLLVD